MSEREKVASRLVRQAKQLRKLKEKVDRYNLFVQLEQDSETKKIVKAFNALRSRYTHLT